MAKIDLTAEVLKHTDPEIIDYLANEARAVRAVYKKTLESGDAQRLFAMSADLAILINVIIALDKRNKENDV